MFPILKNIEKYFLCNLDDKGDSKCVGFGLCIDKDSVKRALNLDGDKFGTKSLRINLASKR